MKQLLRKTIGWFLYLVILIGLIYGIPRGLAYILDSDHPIAAITSGSMWPTLKRGDLILIKGIDGKDEIKTGDIIVYRNQTNFTVHRVKEINGDWLTTKGDANNISDKPIKYEDVVGKALNIRNKPLKLPFLGNISIMVSKISSNL